VHRGEPVAVTRPTVDRASTGPSIRKTLSTRIRRTMSPGIGHSWPTFGTESRTPSMSTFASCPSAPAKVPV
jgi:hypothetical protein